MMFELIFIFVFAATLLVTGITLMSVFGAMALAFFDHGAVWHVGHSIKVTALVTGGVGGGLADAR